LNLAQGFFMRMPRSSGAVEHLPGYPLSLVYGNLLRLRSRLPSRDVIAEDEQTAPCS
jgi:hypothetical protein